MGVYGLSELLTLSSWCVKSSGSGLLDEKAALEQTVDMIKPSETAEIALLRAALEYAESQQKQNQDPSLKALKAANDLLGNHDVATFFKSKLINIPAWSPEGEHVAMRYIAQIIDAAFK